MEVIKKVTKTPCYCCNSKKAGACLPRKTCKACGGDGQYKEEHYMIIVTDKDGNQFAFDKDTLP